MNVVLYKFKNNEWVETKKLRSRDVALLINKDEKTVYIWDGPLSTPRIQTLSKEKLKSIRLHYPDYKFRIVDSHYKDFSEIEALITSYVEDSQYLIKDREQTAKRIDKIIRVFLVLIVSLYFLSIGLLLSRLTRVDALIHSSNDYILYTIFVSRESASFFFSLTLFLIFMGWFLAGIATLFAFYLKQNTRALLLFLSDIFISVMVFYFWFIQIPYFFSFESNGELLFYRSLFDSFLTNSCYILFASIIFVILAGYVERSSFIAKTFSPKKEPPKEKLE